MIEPSIPRCEPASEFRTLPYHWVQWRTPYRHDEPEPWIWDDKSLTWTALGGATYSAERAAQLQWHYVSPARIPAKPSETFIQDLARLLTAAHFAVRFKRPVDNDLVQAAINDTWRTIGLPQALALLDGCDMMGTISIVENLVYDCQSV